MMNEYLLSRYLSNVIIKSTLNTTIEKRTGKAKDTQYTSINKTDTDSLAKNHKLIEDEGSLQYSSWLKRYLCTYNCKYCSKLVFCLYNLLTVLWIIKTSIHSIIFNLLLINNNFNSEEISILKRIGYKKSYLIYCERQMKVNTPYPSKSFNFFYKSRVCV